MQLSRRLEMAVLFGLSLVHAVCAFGSQGATERKLNFFVRSSKDSEVILASLGYDAKRWHTLAERIPRVLISDIPERWSRAASQLSVRKKKSLFFRLVIPAALMANELVTNQRRKLLELMNNPQLSEEEALWLQKLAERYKIKNPSAPPSAKQLQELKRRVDIVPTSLILAQAAIESNWGASRFAVKGNALFGQWTFSGKMIQPKQMRKSIGRYGLAVFKSPFGSLFSYVRNINTHPAYRPFRNLRSTLRARGIKLQGHLFTPTLIDYSERREAYVQELDSIIHYNNLCWTDRARLSPDQTLIVLTPIISRIH